MSRLTLSGSPPADIPTPPTGKATMFVRTPQGDFCVKDEHGNVIELKGEKGEKGEQGQQGENGPAGPEGPAGPGVPAGGTIGQVLAKASADDRDTHWIDPPEGGGGAPTVGPLTISLENENQVPDAEGNWTISLSPDLPSRQAYGVAANAQLVWDFPGDEAVPTGTSVTREFLVMGVSEVTITEVVGATPVLWLADRGLPSSLMPGEGFFLRVSYWKAPDGVAFAFAEAIPIAMAG